MWGDQAGGRFGDPAREDADDGDEEADGLESCFGSMIVENWPKEGRISF